MPKTLLILLFVVSCIHGFSLEIPELEAKSIDHEVLFHWNDLKEIEDQIKFFEIEAEHQKYELELAEAKFRMDQRLHNSKAITDLDFMKSKADVEVKGANLEAATLKVKERLIYIEIKKQNLQARQGKRPSLKKTAQLYADDWKAKFEIGKALVVRGQAELDFINFKYTCVEKLQNHNVSTLEELLEVSEQKKEKESNVVMLTARLKALEKTSQDAQQIADDLTP